MGRAIWLRQPQGDRTRVTRVADGADVVGTVELEWVEWVGDECRGVTCKLTADGGVTVELSCTENAKDAIPVESITRISLPAAWEE